MSHIYDYKSCLKPQFTELLVKVFTQQHASINLIGPPEFGRTRVLRDLQKVLADRTVVYINQRAFIHSLSGLIREIALQIDLDTADFGALTRHLAQSDQHFVVLFDQFEALLFRKDIDPAYDHSFFDHLNHLKNQSNIRLLFSTQEPIDQSVVYVDGKMDTCSRLHLHKERLHKLHASEKRVEIRRRVSLLDLPDKEMEAMIEFCKEDFPLFEFILKRLENPLAEDHGVPFMKKLERWKKENKRNQAPLFARRIVNTTRRLDAWNELGKPLKLAIVTSLGLFLFFITPLKDWLVQIISDLLNLIK